MSSPSIEDLLFGLGTALATILMGTATIVAILGYVKLALQILTVLIGGIAFVILVFGVLGLIVILVDVISG